MPLDCRRELQRTVVEPAFSLNERLIRDQRVFSVGIEIFRNVESDRQASLRFLYRIKEGKINWNLVGNTNGLGPDPVRNKRRIQEGDELYCVRPVCTVAPAFYQLVGTDNYEIVVNQKTVVTWGERLVNKHATTAGSIVEGRRSRMQKSKPENVDLVWYEGSNVGAYV